MTAKRRSRFGFIGLIACLGLTLLLTRAGAATGDVLDRTAPEAVALLALSAMGDTVCEGETATLIASWPDCTGTLSFAWYRGSGRTPIGTGATLQIQNTTLSDAGDYRVTATCTIPGAVLQDDATVQLTVNSNPMVAATGDDVCQGETAALTATIEGCTGHGTLRWYYDWEQVGTGDTLRIANVQQDHAGSYKVVGTCDLTGCDDEETVTLTVRESSSVVATGDTACEGETATLTATTQGCSGTTTIEWYLGTNLVGTGATLTIPNAQVSDSGTYTAIATCSATSCQETDNATLTVHPNPVVEASYSMVCGADLVLSAQLTSGCGTGSVTYTWYKGSSTTPLGTGATYVILPTTPNDSGTYRVVAVCNATGCTDEDTVEATVHTYPEFYIPEFNRGNPQHAATDGETCFDNPNAQISVVIDSTGGCAQGQITYQWYQRPSETGAPQLLQGETGSVLDISGQPAGWFWGRVRVCCGDCCAYMDTPIMLTKPQQLSVMPLQYCLGATNQHLVVECAEDAVSTYPFLNHRWYEKVGSTWVERQYGSFAGWFHCEASELATLSLDVSGLSVGPHEFMLENWLGVFQSCYHTTTTSVSVFAVPKMTMPDFVEYYDGFIIPQVRAEVQSPGECEVEDLRYAWYRRYGDGWREVAGMTGPTLELGGLVVGEYEFRLETSCRSCVGVETAAVRVRAPYRSYLAVIASIPLTDTFAAGP